jgi:hypothetical protein
MLVDIGAGYDKLGAALGFDGVAAAEGCERRVTPAKNAGQSTRHCGV